MVLKFTNMKTCLLCTRKHLAKAMCYLTESRIGYPNYLWRVIGEMCLAEDECADWHPELAESIRKIRKDFQLFASDPINNKNGKLINCVRNSYTPLPPEIILITVDELIENLICQCTIQDVKDIELEEQLQKLKP